MESDCDSTTQTNSSSSLSKLVKHVWMNEAKDKNFVFSPFSIYSALSLLASGSDGQTLKQLLGFLNHKNLNDVNTYVSEILNSSMWDYSVTTTGNKANGDDDGEVRPILSFIGGIWVNNNNNNTSCGGGGGALKPSFKETATSIYRAAAEAVDFKTQAKEVRNKVNKWAEENTEGLVTNLIPDDDGVINKDTNIVLANALYFRGSWRKDQFQPSKTKKLNFYLLNGTSVEVPFMISNYNEYISCFDSFKVLKLPYKQATNDSQKQLILSMYIFLPNELDGLYDLIEKVGSESDFLERHLPKQEVKTGEVRVPKFKILFDIELSRVLKDDLGLDLPFDPEKADLTKMLDSNSPKKNVSNAQMLCVSNAIHKCFVEVDEQGTKAAASTVIVGRLFGYIGKPIPVVPKVNFVADHPFLFTIRDDVNRAILFMGHVLNPSSH